MNTSRKLAAILFADIVGYTSMMQKDEATARQLLDKFHNTLNSKVEKHQGQVINNYGDGCVCTFDSAVAAVQCAKEVQLAFQTEPKVPVRIGLHSGDVFFEKENVYGDSVNIASRIESLGVAGAILFSEPIKRHISNQKDFEVQSLGEFDFKNVEKPMEVFALANEGFVLPKRAEMQGKLKASKQKKQTWLVLTLLAIIGLVGGFFWWKNTKAIPQALSADIIADKSIAVLAFRDLSPKGDQEYFGDGIAEEILNALDQLEDLRVIGRTSSFSFKGKDVPIPEIAQQLNVSTILEGSVRKFNNRVRINVKLVDAKTDQQIWSQSFDRELADIFAIQNEIAVSVANNLKLNLLDKQAEQLAQSSTSNPEAYDIFLKAKLLIDQYTDSRQEPIDLLMQAIKLDPQFVDAYVWLAEAKAWLAWTGEVESKIAFSQAIQVQEFAQNLDSASENVQRLNFVFNYYYHWDWEKVEVAIASQRPIYDTDLSNYYAYTGRHEKAFEFFKKAIKNDPLNLVYRVDGLYNLLAARQFDEAIELGLENIKLFPESTQAYFFLTMAYYFKGDYQKALEMNELAYSKSGRGHYADNMYKLYAIWNLSKLGRKEEAEVILNEFLKKAKTSHIDPLYFAWIYANIDEKEKALDYLEKAYESKSSLMARIKTSPFFDDDIRDEPRFQAILKKMNFPEVVKG